MASPGATNKAQGGNTDQDPPPPKNSRLTMRLSDESAQAFREFQQMIVAKPWPWIFSDRPMPELANATREEQELLAITLEPPEQDAGVVIPFISFSDYLEEGSKLALRQLYECIANSEALKLEVDIPIQFSTGKLALYPPSKQNFLVLELDFLGTTDEQNVRKIYADIFTVLRKHKIELPGAPASSSNDDQQVDTTAYWNPHLVVGKLSAKKKHTSLMAMRRLRVNNERERFRVESVGFGMNGDIPSKSNHDRTAWNSLDFIYPE